MSLRFFEVFFLLASVNLMMVEGRCTNLNKSGFTEKYSLDFTNTDYKKYFSEQYSYDQHDETGEAKHFSIGTKGSMSALKITVLSTDKSFQENSTTDPRSELRETATPLTLGNEFLFEWDIYLDEATAWGSISAFIHQFFGAGGGSGGPAMDLDTTTGNQYAYAHITTCDSDNKTTLHADTATANPKADIGKWINWAVMYKSSDKSDGYVHVYRGETSTCTQIFTYTGPSQGCGSNSGYFKMGIYRHTANVTASLWVADYHCSTKTG